MIPEFNRVYVGDSRLVLEDWPDNCVDAVCTDPPYGLGKEPDPRALMKDWLEKGHHEVGGSGFMSKAWDSFVPQPALWAQVFRVMKPGAHIVAFSGTRTYDWMVLGMRLAGFEIRDQIQWLYAQGFPKSLNVSMQLDKMDSVETRRERALRFTSWMRSTGITGRQVNEATNSNMASHYLTAKEQPEVATADMFDLLRPLLPEVPEDIEELVRWRTVESENFKKRQVVGTKIAVDTSKARLGVPGRDEEGKPLRGTKEISITKEHTELAKKWAGWGTALKPANEPIVLARKPLDGTVADNVMRWGTGALNIKAGRIASGDDYSDKCASVVGLGSNGGERTYGGFDSPREDSASEFGRWPANVILDPYTAGLMDGQEKDASRFFYVAKPDGTERNMGLGESKVLTGGEATDREDGSAGLRSPRAVAGRGGGNSNFHPTVKPIDVMAYLIKIVTPPGGVVLDPFLGSGTTAIAAARLGFPYLGVELSPEYAELAIRRIAAETAQGLLL
jgi:DNA modification methylase